MEKYKIKDSGQRQQFQSGAVRDTNQGKGRPDLISPIALTRLAKHYENGALKYGDNNWQKGIPLKRLVESALRHLNEYLYGNREEDNIIACAWNCFAIAHTESMIMKRKMSPDLAKGLPCFMSVEEMDENTRMWWEKMNDLIKEDDKNTKSKNDKSVSKQKNDK